MRLENWIKNNKAKILYSAIAEGTYDLKAFPKKETPRAGDIYITEKGEQWMYLKDHSLRYITQPGCSIVNEILLDRVSSEEEELEQARIIIYN